MFSRLALLRCDAGHFVLESPLGFGRVVLHDRRAAALCHALSAPRALEEVERAMHGLPLVVIERLVALMLGIEALLPEQPEAVARVAATAMWSPPDLWFHMRSRQGRHDAPYGATYPLLGVIDPAPAVKPPIEGPVIPLFRPDLGALTGDEQPFTRVLETRRSFRRWGARPIRAEELGAWLHRAARIRAVIDQNERRPYVATNRPYPSGGACYPLELYLAVHACEGLAPGLYHYHALDHALSMLSARTPRLDALLTRAQGAMAAPEKPQVLVVVAARVQRVAWKYASMAYATILKDTGALYQTLYLVATALGLAACAVGGGDSELFAAAAGLDPLVEPSVGEFVVGSRPDEGSP